MKIIIFGAGIIGVTSAYFLSKYGYEVIVLDKQQDLALGSSFANGGHLGYTSIAPGEYPSFPLHLFRFLQKNYFTIEQEVRIWQNIRNSFLTSVINKQNKYTLEIIKLSLYRLALYSKELLHQIIEENDLILPAQKQGILHLYFNEKRFKGAVSSISYKKQLGCEIEVLNHNECLDKEPSLCNIKKNIIGGTFSPNDYTGDSYSFTKALADICKKLNVKFVYNTEVENFKYSGNKISSILTNQGEFAADFFISALGVDTPLLMKKVKIETPVYPLKGYSITVNLDSSDKQPSIGIVDEENKIYHSSFEGTLRVAGTQELANYDLSINEKRIDILLNSVTKLFPHLNVEKKDLNDKIMRRACLRPATQGFPIIERSIYQNLFLNTGHGGLGWTLACASGKLIADLISNK